MRKRLTVLYPAMPAVRDDLVDPLPPGGGRLVKFS